MDFMYHKVVVFGGTGFIGRQIVSLLVKSGFVVRVITRNPRKAEFLKVMGSVGQVQIVKGNITKDCSAYLEGMDVTINLVGILHDQLQDFYDLHVTASENLAKTAYSLNIKQYIHFSSLIISDSSDYGKTKKIGESRVIQFFPSAVIIRPNMVYDRDYGFLKDFISMPLPFLILVDGGQTILQPVWVQDVSKFILEIINKEVSGGVYDLIGPQEFSFKDIMELFLLSHKKNKTIISIPKQLAYIFATIFEFRIISLFMKPITGKSEPIFTRDQLKMLDNRTIFESSAFSDMGLEPSNINSVLFD